jgi:hypothetical protein
LESEPSMYGARLFSVVMIWSCDTISWKSILIVYTNYQLRMCLIKLNLLLLYYNFSKTILCYTLYTWNTCYIYYTSYR